MNKDDVYLRTNTIKLSEIYLTFEVALDGSSSSNPNIHVAIKVTTIPEIAAINKLITLELSPPIKTGIEKIPVFPGIA